MHIFTLYGIVVAHFAGSAITSKLGYCSQGCGPYMQIELRFSATKYLWHSKFNLAIDVLKPQLTFKFTSVSYECVNEKHYLIHYNRFRENRENLQ